MTKDELMKMARDSRATCISAGFVEMSVDELALFANAILERAASVCINCCDEGSIRSLKIEEGE